ncbi:MAG: hypothetical protein GF411_07960 [Candidatus Lokiarchaeota archaeon]|nr:hypothetical protein [Candidatus Lokiarchaeota archaeon]
MNRKKLLTIGLIGSVLLNCLAMVILVNRANSPNWMFPEIGPAIMQDSYHNRAPAIESPFGIIGDIPGGYSIYSGGAMVGYIDYTFNIPVQLVRPTVFSMQQTDAIVIITAILFAIVPILIIIILGRKSYGLSKTY